MASEHSADRRAYFPVCSRASRPSRVLLRERACFCCATAVCSLFPSFPGRKDPLCFTEAATPSSLAECVRGHLDIKPAKPEHQPLVELVGQRAAFPGEQRCLYCSKLLKERSPPSSRRRRGSSSPRMASALREEGSLHWRDFRSSQWRRASLLRGSLLVSSSTPVELASIVVFTPARSRTPTGCRRRALRRGRAAEGVDGECVRAR